MDDSSLLEPLPAATDLPLLLAASDLPPELCDQIREACQAWLAKSPSTDTRTNYQRDLRQFMEFAGFKPHERERLVQVKPRDVAAWRDSLKEQGRTNSSVRRKLTVLRSLFSYLQTSGYSGVNPAHSDFVDAPAAPRDGKTVALSPEDCRRLLDAPIIESRKEKPLPEGSGEPVVQPLPEGIRDRALLAILAYSGIRVGELCRLRVGDFKTSSGHRILEVQGKGGKERRVPLHPEAVERLEHWLDVAGLREPKQFSGPLFRPATAARGAAETKAFLLRPITRRAVQYLVERYVKRLRLDSAITVHSLRVTALTTARERGSDIIDLQDFAGHADPRTTLTYIRNRDRLSKSPAYVLKY
jgi:integrase/recombinase XerD